MMLPAVLSIPAPIPLPLNFVVEFGPVVLVIVLALLDVGAVALLRAALRRQPRQVPHAFARRKHGDRPFHPANVQKRAA